MPTLAHDRRGSGPTLVLLHALGADRRMWDPVVDALAGQRDVIALDLPGFGESAPLTATPTPRALAQAVAGALGAMGVEHPHVAGNSLGGWVALELALAGVARSVTAIAPAGLWPRPLVARRRRGRGYAARALPLVDALTHTARARRALLSGSVAHPESVPPRAAAHLIRGYMTAPGYGAANDAMRAATFTGLTEITVPVTLVWPQHDRLVRRPAQLPRNVVNVELADAGHIPTWDQPQAVVAALLAGSSS
jgi:pimeloyl-ACP methyl ester carboxylesterase